jgi:hypothetical protein
MNSTGKAISMPSSKAAMNWPTDAEGFAQHIGEAVEHLGDRQHQHRQRQHLAHRQAQAALAEEELPAEARQVDDQRDRAQEHQAADQLLHHRNIRGEVELDLLDAHHREGLVQVGLARGEDEGQGRQRPDPGRTRVVEHEQGAQRHPQHDAHFLERPLLREQGYEDLRPKALGQQGQVTRIDQQYSQGDTRRRGKLVHLGPQQGTLLQTNLSRISPW